MSNFSFFLLGNTFLFFILKIHTTFFFPIYVLLKSLLAKFGPHLSLSASQSVHLRPQNKMYQAAYWMLQRLLDATRSPCFSPDKFFRTVELFSELVNFSTSLAQMDATKDTLFLEQNT